MPEPAGAEPAPRGLRPGGIRGRRVTRVTARWQRRPAAAVKAAREVVPPPCSSRWGAPASPSVAVRTRAVHVHRLMQGHVNAAMIPGS
ncbi:bS18 family ribosomal protein [Streptomyces pathocidini]|uniref:bS18 family ribosomal protein n=1 Tax=Streptomyces pathocidini TaxID=1650571 RepID=UPI0033C9BEF3